MDNFLVKEYGSQLATHNIELKVSDQSGKYYLPEDAILREKRVVGVAVMDNTAGDIYSPMNRACVSAKGLRNSYLSLVDINNHIIAQHPIPDITVTPQDKTWLPLDLPQFNPSKSFIEVGNPTAANVIAAGESFVLQFAYINI